MRDLFSKLACFQFFGIQLFFYLLSCLVTLFVATASKKKVKNVTAARLRYELKRGLEHGLTFLHRNIPSSSYSGSRFRGREKRDPWKEVEYFILQSECCTPL